MARENIVIADRYRLIKELAVRGHGGGTIWLAYDEDLRQEVTVAKSPLPRPATTSGDNIGAYVAAVREEIDRLGPVAARPDSVAVHDCVEHEGTPWMVSEYVPGAIDLGSHTESNGGLPPRELARVGLAVLDVLCAGHFLGVVHQALTPSTVLLAPGDDGTPHGRVLVAGYGIGAAARAWRATAGAAEDPSGVGGRELGYLPPERVRMPQAPATPAGDIFALGATLYAAAEGHSPFDTPKTGATRDALLHGDPQPPQEAGALAPLLLRMLAKDPARRITPDTVRQGLQEARTSVTQRGAGEGDPWRAAADPATSNGGAPDGVLGPAQERPVRRVKRLVASAKRHRTATVAVGLGVAVVAVVCGAAFVLALDGNEPKPSPSASAPAKDVAFPYGQNVGLTEPLAAGDCLNAVWPGKPLAAEPNLGVVDCETGSTNAQVVATVTFPDVATARSKARNECARQADNLAKSLPYAGTFAVVPTDAGFAATDSATACLVAATQSAFYGEVGRFRDSGIDLYLQQMSIGDCWTYKKKEKDTFEALLVASCARPHTDQVIGFVEAPSGMDLATWEEKSTDLCLNRFDSDWSRGDDTMIWSYTDTSAWDEGFRKAVCAIKPADAKPTTNEYAPAEAPKETTS